jgi:hypothetical protein
MKFLIMSFALSASWISSFQTPAVQQLRTGHTPLPMQMRKKQPAAKKERPARPRLKETRPAPRIVRTTPPVSEPAGLTIPINFPFEL